MKFTDRFLKVQIEVFDKEESELIGQKRENADLALAMIDPAEITYYREDMSTEKDPIDRTVIEFKSGAQLAILMKIEEFESLLNNFNP
jgi:hypothetical protein